MNPLAKKLSAYNNRSSPDKKPIYVVAFEKYQKGNPDPIASGLETVLANDAAEARFQFCRSYPNRRKYKIIAIAPAIGYFVEDKKGDILSV